MLISSDFQLNSLKGLINKIIIIKRIFFIKVRRLMHNILRSSLLFFMSFSQSYHAGIGFRNI